MNLIREFMLVLLITAVTGSILMTIWLVAVHVGAGMRNIRYSLWMLRAVLAGYLMPPAYLLVHRCWEIMRNDFYLLAFSSPIMNQFFLALFIIWAAGILLVLPFRINTWICFRRIKRGSMMVSKKYRQILQKLCKEMNIRKNISLYEGYGVESPFIFGIKNPKIYLPIRDFSMEELEMVLYHELIHYKQGDTFWKPLFGLLGNIYWFNPLSHRLWTEVVRWTEANCDSYCCEERYQKKKYFTLLLEMGSGNKSQMNGYAPMWTEGGKELEWRVKCMKRNRIKKPKGILIALIIISSIASGGISSYAVTNELNTVYNEAYFNTFEGVEEPLEQENELQEHSGTVEDFAGTKIIKDPSEEQDAANPNYLSIDCEAENNTTHYVGEFKANAGEEITVVVSVNPERPISIGIVKQDEKTSYVTDKATILHVFSITEPGTYQVFIMNKSGKKVNAGGSAAVGKTTY